MNCRDIRSHSHVFEFNLCAIVVQIPVVHAVRITLLHDASLSFTKLEVSDVDTLIGRCPDPGNSC